MGDYWSFFSQYFNLLAIIGGGIKISLLSFGIVLILLFVFKKIVLVKRYQRVRTYLAYSYYFWIPIVCLIWGFIYGVITTSRNQVIEKLPLYQTSIQSIIDQNFDLNVEIKNYTDKNLDNVLDDVVTKIRTVMTMKLKQPDNSKTLKLVIMVLDSPIGSNYIKSSLKDKISATVSLKRELTDEIFEIKFSKLFTSDVIVKVFSFYIKQMVNSFLIPIMLVGILLLLIPLIEIVLANCYNRKHSVVVMQRSAKML